MSTLLRFLFILAYFSFQLASTEQSTRERIAMHKKWLEQRELRKKLLIQERLANNGTIRDFWPSYKRYKPDHNSKPQNERKSERKPLDLQLKSKRKKQQQQILENSVLPNESYDISKFAPTTTLLPLTSFVTEQTTTVGITKSTQELQVTNLAQNTKSEINTHINDRMNLNGTTNSQTNKMMSTTTEHSITYNVTAHNSKGVRPANQLKGKKQSNAIWGRWEKWTNCSRSCGGGVMSQSRFCLNRDSTLKNRISNECIGLYKRYRICNEQSCPDDELDFRDQQCVFYNNHSFYGKIYSWESYIVDEAECELNCKPIGMDYFAKLNDMVIDGTSCSWPSDFVRQNHSGRALCVDGVCKFSKEKKNLDHIQ